MAATSQSLRIAVPGAGEVSALLDLPAQPFACYVFAHGAGAGMEHAFMAAMAESFVQRGIAVLRFQFPFMEQGSRRTDAPPVAQEAVRAAVQQAAARMPGLPLFAGGKSFGGRMTSQAQAVEPLPGVRGLVFVGFPLHPAGKPSIQRAEHLEEVKVPMLFLQGTRDALADLDLVRNVASGLRDRATLQVVDGADHAFHVLARSGRNDAQVRDEILDAAVAWMRALALTP